MSKAEGDSQPEISIIMPVYNGQSYLDRAINSIIKQTFKNFELIVVDDGSIDNSLMILEKYSRLDYRVRVFSQANSGHGPGAARNNGLSKAQGRYIMFCDADDSYEPDMCSVMYEHILNDDVDIVCCNVNIVKEYISITEGNIKRLRTEDYFKNKFDGLFKIVNEVIVDTNVVLWNKIFKRDLIDKYKICFLENNWHDDDGFYLKYMSVSNAIRFVNSALYNYIWRDDSIMGIMANKKRDDVLDYLFVSKCYFDFLKKYNLHKRINVFYWYLVNRCCIDKYKMDVEKFNEIKKYFFEIYEGNWELAKWCFVEYKHIMKLLISASMKIKEKKLYRQYVLKICGKKLFSISLLVKI